MDRLVALAVNRRFLMVGMFVAVLFGGLIAFNQLNIEAYPDPTPPMVDIVTQSPGLSAEEIERYITIPIETQVAGLKNLTTIRTISLYGLSDVKLQFSFAYTYDEALQQVLNRLAQLAPLPGNVQPQISPLSPIGEIFRYRLVGPPNYSVLDLKTIQDWILQRRFRAVPGVIDVTGWGGKSKTYELQVDFNKLVANGLTLPQLLQAVGNSNVNVGGNTVNIGQQSAVVRGVGLIRSIDDLANTMVAQTNGNPVLVKDVATVTVGQKPRLGIAGLDDSDDIVQGIVLMRRGEQSSPTIKRVHQLVQTINDSSILPPGVRIERIYDRGDLIELTTHTVLHNMVVGILLIVLLQWIFLGDLRSALIVGATIPFALFFAVIILVLRGESANLLSVGAIDFGLIVDATVIMVEAIFRRLTQTTPMSESEQMSSETLFGMKKPRHPQRGGRRLTFDLLCRGDHHRGLPAAVHALRRRGQHLRADGAHLCLRACRRPPCDVHGDASAVRDHPAGSCQGDRDQGDADPASALHAIAELGGRQPRHHARWRARPRADDGCAQPVARPRIPAQAGRG
ncbi:Cu/Ag efflux pump CusA [Bradyrhizobium sp. LB7.2]